MRNGKLSQHNTNTHGYTRTHGATYMYHTQKRNKKQRIETGTAQLARKLFLD